MFPIPRRRRRQATLRTLRRSTSRPLPVAARPSAGAVLGDALEALLAFANAPRERLVDAGLQFVRRRGEAGSDYFIANWTADVVDRWVPLAAALPAAALFDPMTGETGIAKLRTSVDAGSEVYLQLDPGESIIVRGLAEAAGGRAFGYFQPAGAPQQIAGDWRLKFVEGGPELPAAASLESPASWTELGRGPRSRERRRIPSRLSGRRMAVSAGDWTWARSTRARG
jgi:hypothetical protein